MTSETGSMDATPEQLDSAAEPVDSATEPGDGAIDGATEGGTTEPEPDPLPPPPPSLVRPYINKVTGEIRDIDDLVIYGWTVAGNPKAEQWEPYTPPEPPVPPPTPNWEHFEDAALGSDSLKQLVPQIGETSPVALTMLGGALLRAKTGDVADFLRVWKRILDDLAAAGTPIDSATFDGFVRVATDCNLPEAFIYALQGQTPPKPELELGTPTPDAPAEPEA